MTRPAPAWHAEARELHKNGTTSREIAAIYGKRLDTVRLVLDEARYAAALKRHVDLRARKAKARFPEKRAKPDNMEIARLFAAGEIDFAELSRRLRGEARL